MKIINHTKHCLGILSFTILCVLTLHQPERHQPCFIGVNLKSGRYFLSLLLLAVFLNCPSDLEVSYCFQRVKVQRRRICCLFDTLLHLKLATLVTLFSLFFTIVVACHRAHVMRDNHTQIISLGRY